MLRDESEKTTIEELKQLNLKIDSLIGLEEKILNTLTEFLRLLIENKPPDRDELKVVPDATALLTLPGSLRKTVLAVYKLGEATADDLSNETGRLRAVESASASQLARSGYLKKKRVGRKVFYYIDSSLTER